MTDHTCTRCGEAAAASGLCARHSAEDLAALVSPEVAATFVHVLTDAVYPAFCAAQELPADVASADVIQRGLARVRGIVDALRRRANEKTP